MNASSNGEQREKFPNALAYQMNEWNEQTWNGNEQTVPWMAPCSRGNKREIEEETGLSNDLVGLSGPTYEWVRVSCNEWQGPMGCIRAVSDGRAGYRDIGHQTTSCLHHAEWSAAEGQPVAWMKCHHHEYFTPRISHFIRALCLAPSYRIFHAAWLMPLRLMCDISMPWLWFEYSRQLMEAIAQPPITSSLLKRLCTEFSSVQPQKFLPGNGRNGRPSEQVLPPTAAHLPGIGNVWGLLPGPGPPSRYLPTGGTNRRMVPPTSLPPPALYHLLNGIS